MMNTPDPLFIPPGTGGFGVMNYSTDRAPLYVQGVTMPDTQVVWFICGRSLDTHFASARTREDAEATARTMLAPKN